MAPNTLCRMMNQENAALMPKNFNVTNIFVPIIFNKIILFQKPIEDRESIIKVIEAEVIAIKAKDQELSGGFPFFCAYFDMLCYFL